MTKTRTRHRKKKTFVFEISYDSSAKFELHKTRPERCSCVGSKNPFHCLIKSF